jgi:hypothetical protein
LILAAMATLVSACSGGSSRSAITGPIGTTTGVVLSSSTGTTQIQQGASVVITATVTNDINNAGVTWALEGAGALSNQTSTSVTYTAPTGVIGTTTPVLTATSIADTTKTAGATLVVLGTPIIEATTLFPGNVSSAYGAAINASGGLAPFTWVLAAGTLPPGISLGTTATTSFTTLTGTPTTAGTYSFTVTATDANKIVASVDLTLVINAAEACLLSGQYAVLYSGFVSNQPAVSAAGLTVSSTGTISGYHDYVTGTASVAESITGTCTTRTANNGTLTLTGTANSPQYDYAVTTGLDRGRVQLMNGGDTQSGTGLILKQDPSAFALGSLAGNFAFGALGAQADGSRMGIAGAITLDATGAVSGGHADANGSSALTDAPLAGSLGAPDTNGRGTLTLSGGSQTFHFAYYIVDINRLLIVSTDVAPRLAGFLTRQSGSFDNTSLASPGILSLWGAVATAAAPKSVLALGRLANGNAAAGTLDLALDSVSELTATFQEPIPGALYAVRADGRATLAYTIAGATHQFALYLDGPANGYVVEQGSAAGSAGLLEAQTAGPYSSTVPGLFVSGTQYPQDAAPLLLLPSVRLAAGAFSSSNASGYYSLDTATGRGIGTLTAVGSAASVFTLYMVAPNKVITLRLPATSRSAVIEWLGS